MSRYTGSVCRLCRREGQKLFLKGERCYTEKCAMVARKASTPGQHGQSRKKVSDYGIQLRAKQMTKRYYGVGENQFHHYYEMATRKEGTIGDNLMRFLELRLDNVVYRAGLASSRKEARQLVLHRHFTVNGRTVNIPSYQVKVGDEIAVAKNFTDSDKLDAIIEANGARPVPQWISKNAEAQQMTIAALPNRADIELEVDELLIVELYSK